VIDGVSEPVDHAHVGVDGVDPLVDVGDLSEAARSDSDDLLQDEVGGVEPDRELVGSERSERLLTADELQRYLAKVDGGRVEDDPSGFAVAVVAQQRELGLARVVGIRVLDQPLVRAVFGVDAPS